MNDGPKITLTATFGRDEQPSSVFAFGPERATKAAAEADLDYFPRMAGFLVHTGITPLGKLYYQIRMVANVMVAGHVNKSAMRRYRSVIRNAECLGLIWEQSFVNSYGSRDQFESAVWVRS